ncbi:acetyl-CoA synthetase-like protein [Periconia macrospinosa]|uniref:Acetyl-CoA synthetase-like protein n=1 Tax=Periconia macrospinosa TaxID=97972 RepID=A0A2V1DR04_9PLEO|nr:acetyl-CoA synthetase-like protein [Periconia macrospinosa]
MDINLFICTLGQAATLQAEPKPYQTVNEFLSHQSGHHGNEAAVGFPIPSNEGKWSYVVLTFRDLYNGAGVFAQRLSESFKTISKARQTVALLAHSSPEFLFTWLGLMALGHSVLLIAPQCPPDAIAHLCASCDVTLLVHDDAHSNQASEAVKTDWRDRNSGLDNGCIPLQVEEDIFQIIKGDFDTSLITHDVQDTDLSYLFHTSGTSSGLPKPIPQTHRAAIGVLPHLPNTPSKATFTTTPLYHGGIADLFRSWTSDSLICLFPSKDVPITARNICKCLELANEYAVKERHSRIKYFSSVPYVLQMMEADKEGLDKLQKMDIVGVGGAALPTEIGDRLIDQGVNLVSRFGSAECGFLLSSYRDFVTDREWQYLRNYSPTQILDFRNEDDGLAELIVKRGWPHMAKTNQEDGSFATADLFVKHQNIKNAWLYHSRADSQLTLLTGKKFDPAPLEAKIAASTRHVDDVLIFGNNKPYPGAILIRSKGSEDTPDEDILEDVWLVVEEMNKTSQDHAKLQRNMLITAPHLAEPLQKSSKGTLIRKAAEARLADLIDSAYDTNSDAKTPNVDDKNIPQYLLELIQKLAPGPEALDLDTELFSYGVDSIMCMRLRNTLSQLVGKQHQELPLSVVEDSGTVRRLSDYILRKRHGVPDAGAEDDNQLMLDMVKEYSSFDLSGQTTTKSQASKNKPGKTVILTGATGALGVHILNLLRNSSTVSAIYCLARGSDEHAARERVHKTLEEKGFNGLSPEIRSNKKIEIVQAKLGDARLGLSNTVYEHLAAQADLILHIGWTVNFRLKLQSFAKDNIAGVRNLINLALAAGRTQPPRFAYCSSTAAIMNGKPSDSGHLTEVPTKDPSDSSPLGYSRSKWVAEQICAEAHRQTRLRGNICIVRVGQLSGDSNTGIWNTKEAWPMMLSTAKLVGSLPNLKDEPIDWLPVDIAAEAFVQAAENLNTGGQQLNVYHVLNPHQEPTWQTMLQWLQKKDEFDVVDPAEWVRRLEQHSGDMEHSAMKLIGLWKDSYVDASGKKPSLSPFSIMETQKRVPVLRDIQPLDETYILRVWEWVQKNVR